MSDDKENLTDNASGSFSGAEASTSLTRPLILVADDQDMVRMAALHFLKDAGVDGESILEVVNGHEALKTWQDNKDEIGVVFTDNRMPWFADDNEEIDVGLSGVLTRICLECEADGREKPLMILHSNDVNEDRVKVSLDKLGAVGIAKNDMDSVMPDILEALGVKQAPASTLDAGMHND